MTSSIVLVKPHLSSRGGLEKHALRILKALVENHHKVTLLTTPGFSTCLEGVTIVELPASPLLFKKAMKKWIQAHSPSLVFAADRTSFATHIRAGNGVHKAFLRSKIGAQGYLSYLLSYCNWKHLWALYLEKKSFSNPLLQTIFVNSHKVAQEITKHYKVPSHKIVVLHNGVEWKEREKPLQSWEKEKKAFCTKENIDPSLPHLLFVGNGFMRKGLLPLLRALRTLPRNTFFLSIVGKDKKLSSLEKLVHKWGLSSSIRFFGPQDSLTPFYQAADVLVLLSSYDPFANVTIEALSMGLFVVTSQGNGAKEVLQQETGILVEDPQNIAEVQSALLQALQKKKTTSSISTIRSTIEHLDFSQTLPRLLSYLAPKKTLPPPKETWKDRLLTLLLFPFGHLPLSWLRFLGKRLGSLCYHFFPLYRKRTLSNLALASRLALCEKELLHIAKKSLQNLCITCLEYPKLLYTKNLSTWVHCKNPEVSDAMAKNRQGRIFFCAHLANWEVLFLDGTYRMEGIAIGKPTNNLTLYHWVQKMRERFGGRIVNPKNALREGLQALRRGAFVGIVGDQGMANSSYTYPFLGRMGGSSTAPALLAYKTQSPLFFAETERTPTGYEIRYSDPIWPNTQEPLEKEIPRLMDTLLHLLEKRIERKPEEWLWQHNRWKQQTPKTVYKTFRHDCIGVALQKGQDVSILRTIYPTEHLIVFAPKDTPLSFTPNEVHYFSDPAEILQIRDYKIKLFFDFLPYKPLKKHFLGKSAFSVWRENDLRKKNPNATNLNELLATVLCKNPRSLYAP